MNHIDCAAHYDRIIIQPKYKKENDDCAICLDSLFGKNVSYLPCKHFFHSSCFNKSVDSGNLKCPLCRYDLTITMQQTDQKDVWNNLFTTITFTYAYVDVETVTREADADEREESDTEETANVNDHVAYNSFTDEEINAYRNYILNYISQIRGTSYRRLLNRRSSYR